MQTTPATLPEHLIYGIQLWQLNCLYWDGRNYRYSRTHSAVDASQRGRIAVQVNRALKSRFASPEDLHAAAKGIAPPMPNPSAPPSLRELLPAGSVVYTVTTRESRTESASWLLVLAVRHGAIVSVTPAVAALFGLTLQYGTVLVPGARGAAGGLLVQRLAAKLHGNAGALTHCSVIPGGSEVSHG